MNEEDLYVPARKKLLLIEKSKLKNSVCVKIQSMCFKYTRAHASM